MWYDVLETEVVGPVLVAADPLGLREVRLLAGEGSAPPDRRWRHDPEAVAEATGQLREYLAGQRTTFDLTLAPAGTPFQRQVWAAVQGVPFGQTTTYGALAAALGAAPGASRAVGAANGRNPLPIVVPCHRVVGASGRLVGYRGGLALKRALLDHERRHSSQR